MRGQTTRRQLTRTEQKQFEQVTMSEGHGDGGKPTETGGPSSTSMTATAAATMVDSTIKVLLPQLTETIEQQVARAVKEPAAQQVRRVDVRGASREQP